MYSSKRKREVKLNEKDYSGGTRELIKHFKQFISEMRSSSRRREETIRGYINTFELFVKLMPGISLKTINSTILNKFFERMDDRERPVGRRYASGNPIKVKTGVKDSTIVTYRSKLNKFFEWLITKKLLKDNPFWYLEAPDVNYEDIKYFNDKEVERIFYTIEHKIKWKNDFIKKRNIAIFSILINCGLRKGELISIRMQDIDFDERLLKVRAETSKSKRERLIPLNLDVYNHLMRYIEKRRRTESFDVYLLVNEKGEKFTKHGLKHLAEKVKLESGLNCHLHRFRHTFAIKHLTRNNNQFALKQLMGHKDLRMTNHYVKYIPTDTLRESMERLNIDSLV